MYLSLRNATSCNTTQRNALNTRVWQGDADVCLPGTQLNATQHNTTQRNALNTTVWIVGADVCLSISLSFCDSVAGRCEDVCVLFDCLSMLWRLPMWRLVSKINLRFPFRCQTGFADPRLANCSKPYLYILLSFATKGQSSTVTPHPPHPPPVLGSLELARRNARSDWLIIMYKYVYVGYIFIYIYIYIYIYSYLFGSNRDRLPPLLVNILHLDAG